MAEPSSTERALHPYMDPKREITKAMPGLHLVHKRKLLSEEGRKLTELEAHMRRARQRSFKDEFVPASAFGGAREGYYFTTGFRGLGYYLDPKWCNYNDPDNEGYVLVRTAPAVAIARAMRKRDAEGKQGLLFSPALLDALGPAHGKPPHRYKLVAPPWLCGARPPVERFEKNADVGGRELYVGCNELLREKLEVLSDRLARVGSDLPAGRQYPTPVVARVAAKKGAIVRRGVELDSPEVCELATGTAVLVVEEATAKNQTSRAKLVEPARGWVSMKTLEMINNGMTTDLAVVENVAETVVVHGTHGDITLRGDDLVPVAKGNGPWTLVVTLAGPDERETPLAFKATLKKTQLTMWSAHKLLQIFAKQHAAKHGTSWNQNDLRLHEDESAKDHVDPDTRLAELVRDWDAEIAADLIVRRKLGADGSKPVVFARALELARREDARGPTITEWSSQTDVIKAHVAKGASEEPMTSQEIQDYWANKKDYKHWRTTAALKGMSTRTDDQSKLDKWATTLVPQRGFLDTATPLYSDQDIEQRKHDDIAKGSNEARFAAHYPTNSRRRRR
ncbi:hypothetical protein CTAYLR_003711 [Chrysophaeum taylorii]|uniref:Uncharacterized protein n=1 Tax=Chrysophaeum taylorii TaxID=2483200 RepID=A0AAD7XR55_9STRA|nr:hypothetical protein CTAYLR_003711 [Chrysophaeum taylorii]